MNPNGPFTPECTCHHKYDIPLGSIVEIVITSLSETIGYHFHHPVHLHGNAFYVVGTARGVELGRYREIISLINGTLK